MKSETCPTCGQSVVRAPILKTGAFRWNGENWHMDGWHFGSVPNVGGWTPEELATIAATESEIRGLPEQIAWGE